MVKFGKYVVGAGFIAAMNGNSAAATTKENTTTDCDGNKIEFAENDLKNNKIVINTLDYLRSIPQMKSIFENLPDTLTYDFSSETPGIASFDCNDNNITIKTDDIDFNNTQDLMEFNITLAHELCHANQKKEGIYFNDLSGASFGDTFRIAKMMEIEARLLSVIVENELLKRKEFNSCSPSIDCLYYQKELKNAKGNISQANTNFVLSYWQNAKNSDNINDEERSCILSRYFFYAEQAYHQAIIYHNANFMQLSTNKTSPISAVNSYIKRMSLKGISPEIFLQEKYDNVQTTGNFADGITILNYDGSKYLNLSPTNNIFFDKATFFENNEVGIVFLRNGITGEMFPYSEHENTNNISTIPNISTESIIENSSQTATSDASQSLSQHDEHGDQNDLMEKSANLSAFEIAIEKRNMDWMIDIFSKDPAVINRQTIVNKSFPLLMAIQNDNSEAVSFILSKKPNMLLTTEDNKNVLTELHKLSDESLRNEIETLYASQNIATKIAINSSRLR